MSYPGYDAKTKFEIIKQIWKGTKVAPLSRKFGISRDSIHRWINEVEEKTFKSLAPTTPGPKIDPILHLRQKNEELSSLVKKLQDKIEALSHIYQITVSSKASSLLEKRPSR